MYFVYNIYVIHQINSFPIEWRVPIAAWLVLQGQRDTLAAS